MNFGDNLKNIRKSKNISQETLAEKLGVSRQSISKWETGENYPSMNNIMCLCDIFKCKINELVHEDMTDINLLDNEIKMSVVKFKEKEQKRMKTISKLIYIISRISKIVSITGIIIAIFLIAATAIAIPNSNINPKTQIIEVFDKEYKYELKENRIIFEDNKETIELSSYEEKAIDNFLSKGKVYQTSFLLIIFISVGLSSIFLYKMLNYLEKLFININEKDTPFSLENVTFVKKIALYNALLVISSDILGTIAGYIFHITLNVDIDIKNYLFVLVIIALSYIFKYGYEIQLDSNGKIYGKDNK